ERYLGTDFSREAIERVREWSRARADLPHLELLEQSATEFQPSQGAPFDTVIINSVVQYFPDLDYLQAVLRRALGVLGEGGRIFIGDVRHLGLLSSFHTAVQLERAAPHVTTAELRRRIARAVAQEKELV